MRAVWFLVPQLSPALFFENKQSSTNGSGLKESPTLSSIDAKDSPTLSVVGENESLMKSAKNDQAMSPVTVPVAFVEKAAQGLPAQGLPMPPAQGFMPAQGLPAQGLPMPAQGLPAQGLPPFMPAQGAQGNMPPLLQEALALQGAMNRHDHREVLSRAQNLEEYAKRVQGDAHQYIGAMGPSAGMQGAGMLPAAAPPQAPAQPPVPGVPGPAQPPVPGVPGPAQPPGSFMETPTEQSIPIGVEQHHIQSATRTSFRGSLPSRVSEGEKSL